MQYFKKIGKEPYFRLTENGECVEEFVLMKVCFAL